MISGYMGSKGTFDHAIGEFAVEYADQNERDYRAFVKAVRAGGSTRLLSPKSAFRAAAAESIAKWAEKQRAHRAAQPFRSSLALSSAYGTTPSVCDVEDGICLSIVCRERFNGFVSWRDEQVDSTPLR